MIMNDPSVLLIHGLAESSLWMAPLGVVLMGSGYDTHFIDYPSTSFSIEDLTEIHLERAIQSLADKRVIHVVAHSMGAVMIRYYLQNHRIPNIGRVVMLAPGNAGSPMLSLYRRHPLFPVILGLPGIQSGSGETRRHEGSHRPADRT